MGLRFDDVQPLDKGPEQAKPPKPKRVRTKPVVETSEALGIGPRGAVGKSRSRKAAQGEGSSDEASKALACSNSAAITRGLLPGKLLLAANQIGLGVPTAQVAEALGCTVSYLNSLRIGVDQRSRAYQAAVAEAQTLALGHIRALALERLTIVAQSGSDKDGVAAARELEAIAKNISQLQVEHAKVAIERERLLLTKEQLERTDGQVPSIVVVPSKDIGKWQPSFSPTVVQVPAKSASPDQAVEQ